MKRPLTQQLPLFLLLLICTTAIAQEYTYSPNGGQISDVNKQIAYIHYNYLNLVDTVVHEDGRKVIYLYSATGQKLGEKVIAANGSQTQKRDYFNNFLYLNDTLREVQQADGRLVPVLPGNASTPFEYQYHLADHLNNVRSTITSNNDPVQYTATLESEQSEQEENLFSGLSDHRVTHVAANHTTGGNEAAQLMSGTADGVSLNLAVKNGDTLHLSVYAYYESSQIDAGNGLTRDQNVMNALLPVVENVLSGGVPLLSESSGVMRSSSGGLNGMLAGSATNSEGPPIAHLNYQLFDKNYQLIDGGFVAVTQNAFFAHELLVLDSIPVKKSGYLHVYLSNTSLNNQAVFFDDLKVEHTKSLVVQEDSYDPFGMTLAEQHDERAGEVLNQYLYNSKELQEDLGLNWYDYGARMYDPALGRFFTQDRFAEKYSDFSPYQYAANNPVSYIDVNGDNPDLPPSHDADPTEKNLYVWYPWKKGDIWIHDVDEKNYRESQKPYYSDIKQYVKLGPFGAAVIESHRKAKTTPVTLNNYSDLQVIINFFEEQGYHQILLIRAGGPDENRVSIIENKIAADKRINLAIFWDPGDGWSALVPRPPFKELKTVWLNSPGKASHSPQRDLLGLIQIANGISMQEMIKKVIYEEIIKKKLELEKKIK
jgi:RHS repeat-associated protein